MTRARRIGIQGPLGFGSGVPLYLTGGTLTAWMTVAGVDLKAIGLFALVALPYNLKFLWAPLLDRYAPPLWSGRRGWMVTFQLCLIAAIALMAGVDPRGNPEALVVVALMVVCLSATLDIVVDAYRTDVLEREERGRGTAAYVIGYRTALILTGGGAIALSRWVPWPVLYLCMAGLMTVAIVGTLAAPAEPETTPPPSLRAAVIEPFAELFRRRGALVAIAFVLLFKVGDWLSMQLLYPFLDGRGYSELEIGLVQKFAGMSATIAGAVIGGAMVDRIGVRRALLWFGGAQAFANAGYVWLAVSPHSVPGLIGAVVVDNLCNGLGMAAFLALIMSLCDRRFSAAQYALLTSASSVVGRILSAASGFIVTAVGWAAFFAGTIALAVPALVLIRWLPRDAE